MLNHSLSLDDPTPDLSLTEVLASIPASLQLAFLQRLFDFNCPYPWLTDTAASLVYFETLDQELNHLAPDFAPDTADTAHLDQAWQALSQRLEASWSDTPAPRSWRSLHHLLCEQFESRIPADILATLAQTAQQAMQSTQSMADQLVQCAQVMVPSWDTDDLHVMARPMAYAFRGVSTEDMVEAALRSVRFAAWTELSGVEKARLSLAIARYALAQADGTVLSAGA